MGKEEQVKQQISNKLDRDCLYRTTALSLAVTRAGQNGGLDQNPIDVLGLAEIYYSWLLGEEDVKPGKESEYIHKKQTSDE